MSKSPVVRKLKWFASSLARRLLVMTCMSLAGSVAFSGSARAGAQIDVSDLEALYAAVNDAANAGATVVLAPGVYALSANDPGGVPRANGGRLELQEGMSLLGVVGDNTAVVIEAAGLPVASYTIVVPLPNLAGVVVPTPTPTGAIRMGRGSNAVEWLTVQNVGARGSAGIETDLIWAGTAYIRVAHVRSSGHFRGLDIRNFGPQASGAVIEADVVDNDFFDNTFVRGEGIRVANFQGVVGGVINVRMSGNRSYGNRVGRLLVNNRATNSSVSVVSTGNRFENNGSGTTILGGLSSPNLTANGNTVVLDAHGDRFLDNTNIPDVDRGGLVIIGGENTAFANGASDNTVTVRLSGCRMLGNQLWDLAAIGARSTGAATGLAPGANNTVTVELDGVGNEPFVEFVADSMPVDPTGTNTATIVR